MSIATKETWRTFITKKEADTLQLNGADNFAEILALRERLRNSLAGSVSDEAYGIFQKLGIPLAGGWGEDQMSADELRKELAAAREDAAALIVELTEAKRFAEWVETLGRGDEEILRRDLSCMSGRSIDRIDEALGL